MEVNLDILPSFLDFFKSKKRICLLLGGGGSGKSHAAAQKVILRMLNPNISDVVGSTDSDHLSGKELDDWKKKSSVNFLIVRQTLSSMKESTFSLLVRLIYEMGLQEYFKINQSTMKITCTLNGNYCISKGLDDSEKLKSIDGINNIWVEEATQCSKEAIDELFWRMRASCNYNQMIMTFNPISAKHWIKELWDSDNEEIYKLKTTFTDNPKLPDNIKNSLLNQYKPGTYRHNVYVLAMWGSVKSDSSLYHSFDDIHIRNNKLNRDLPLHLSFDFNYQPHSVCLAFQINEELKEILLVDEVIQPYPATSKGLAQSVIDRFSNWNNFIYVYGDASGQNNSTASNKSNFSQIVDMLESHFGKEYIKYKVASKNPDIIKSVGFLNHIFEGLYDYNIFIDTDCNETIDDLMNTKSDRNGSKLKEMGKTSDGVTFEKWSHCTDTMRYFICGAFQSGYNEYNTRGKSTSPMIGMRESKISGGTPETQRINSQPQGLRFGMRQRSF